MVDSKENYKFDLWVKGLRAIPCYRLYIQRPIFLETNFLNKLILHSFELIIFSAEENFPFFNRGCQYFCVKLCCEHYKKNNLQFNVFTWHLFSCEWSIQAKIKKSTVNMDVIFCSIWTNWFSWSIYFFQKIYYNKSHSVIMSIM